MIDEQDKKEMSAEEPTPAESPDPTETPAPAETPIPTVEEPVYPRQEQPQEAPVAPVQEQYPTGGAAYYQTPPGWFPQGTPPVPPQWQAPQGVPSGQPQYPPYSSGFPGYPDPTQTQSPYPYAPPQYAPQAYPYPYGVPPIPQKKKLSTGLKVFIWVASILAALAIFGFAGYLVYHMAVGNGFDISDYSGVPGLEEFLPDGGDEEDGGDDTPDFDDSVTPPDADDPLPEVDVTPNNEGIQISEIPQGDELSAQEVYEKVVKSTVTVAATLERSGQEENSTGTGIIATSDGYIITNAHVVLNSKSTRVKVTTCDGEEYDAIVVGIDRTTDLAVLKTNDHDFAPAEFGNADELVIGDSVIAIGNPGGAKFSGSMTGGYVSGLDREVGKYSENGMTYIQTDAAINPGNSGGPLVNMYGQVVGINSSKIITDGYEGMGFAIPISKAQPIINQLLSGGYVKGRVRLGITGTDTANIQNYFFSGGPEGFMITEINEDSVFTGLDVREGDVITAVDGETVTGFDEMSNLLLKYSPGDKITLTLSRSENGDWTELEVEITLLEDKGETQQ